MKKLIVAILALTLSVSVFATFRYEVRNFCIDEAISKYGEQSTLNPSWKHADCGAHTVRDFAILEQTELIDDVDSRFDPTSGLPGSPTWGDAYISTATANGWTATYFYIYGGYDGATWEEEIPHEGQEIWVADEDHDYIYYGGAWYKSLELPIGGSMYFSFIPPGNGAVELVGWYEQTDTAKALSNGSPITASEKGYHSHFVIDVSSSVGHPYTITVTGTSVDEDTGTETGSDTEAISVTGNGYYQTTKSWVDAVVFTIPATKTCTIDVYRTSYWDRGNREFTATGVRMEWKPDAATWSIQLRIQKVAADGSVSDIDNKTFANTDTPPRAENGEIGKYKRTDYGIAVAGDGNEGIVVSIVDQTAIESFYVEFRFNK